ncbi:hypothetical protein TI03_07505, partial [Achromatium sp. WMS1]
MDERSIDAVDDGEVEDHKIDIRNYDYGDAPDTSVGSGVGNYQTTQADGGPYHAYTSSLKMGSAATDSDSGTLQNVAANADDANASDDEDGVASLAPLNTSATEYSVTIITANSTGSSANLYGWIDFNKNGIFESGEFASATVANGATSANLNWSGLSGLTDGTTYAR